jgi:two-component system chemotaxis response regulator CheY
MTHPRKILLTDDEPHIRKFIGLVLKKLGDPRILEAADGAIAVKLFEQEKPDLVLLDVNMPNMDGIQALAEIRRIDPDAIVVMLTSLANRQTVEECVRRLHPQGHPPGGTDRPALPDHRGVLWQQRGAGP